ncbi:MAG: hypothetical protein MZU91_01745 [Desulfosudis oleivorans]|nr:hypothetical protein [Desulfosudis oleivorans]
MRRLTLAEEAGLVHTVRNNVKDDMFMCNCCPCCCTAMFLHNADRLRCLVCPFPVPG